MPPDAETPAPPPGAQPDADLRPAEENPWYVLATLWGEQGNVFDEDLHARNRRTWNRWIAQALTPEAIRGLVDKGADPADFEPLDADERAEMAARAEARGHALPDPGTPDAPARIDFRNCIFQGSVWASRFVAPGKAVFNGATFRDLAVFAGATFCGQAVFAGATFRDTAGFAGATFRDLADFHGATFREQAHFADATFRSIADFGGSSFRATANFDGATFDDLSRFAGSTFYGNAEFRRTAFDARADFAGAIFREWGAEFDGATFRGMADFSGATFGGPVWFAKGAFESRVDFVRTRFDGDVPDFRDRAFPHATDWRGAIWPQPRSLEDPEDAKERYAALRHAMEEAGRFEHARDFFALQLACRRITADWPERLAIGAYVGLSDVGRSVVRPMGAWLLALLVVWIVQFEVLVPGNRPPALHDPRAVAFDTFSMALGGAVVVGSPALDPRRGRLLEDELGTALYDDFRCGTAAPSPVCEQVAAKGAGGGYAATPRAIPDGLKALQVLHTAFSALCLFLAGLGLRNWLRIR